MAIGHKILEVIFVILKNKKPYQDPGINYEELTVDRNSSRWIKALVKYGHLEKGKQVA